MPPCKNILLKIKWVDAIYFSLRHSIKKTTLHAKKDDQNKEGRGISEIYSVCGSENWANVITMLNLTLTRSRLLFFPSKNLFVCLRLRQSFFCNLNDRRAITTAAAICLFFSFFFKQIHKLDAPINLCCSDCLVLLWKTRSQEEIAVCVASNDVRNGCCCGHFRNIALQTQQSVRNSCSI